MPVMPQNKEAQKIAQKIMGVSSSQEWSQIDKERTALQLKKETSSLVRS